jgi:hypothetical protein
MGPLSAVWLRRNPEVRLETESCRPAATLKRRRLLDGAFAARRTNVFARPFKRC